MIQYKSRKLMSTPIFILKYILVIQAKKQPFTIQNLESVNRITNIPIVESSWHYAENMYNKIKVH